MNDIKPKTSTPCQPGIRRPTFGGAAISVEKIPRAARPAGAQTPGKAKCAECPVRTARGKAYRPVRINPRETAKPVAEARLGR